MDEWLKKIMEMKMFDTMNIDEIKNIIRVPGGMVLNQDTYRLAGNVPGTTRKFLFNFSSVFIPIDEKLLTQEAVKNGK
jgi:hypothetical protein